MILEILGIVMRTLKDTLSCSSIIPTYWSPLCPSDFIYFKTNAVSLIKIHSLVFFWSKCIPFLVKIYSLLSLIKKQSLVPLSLVKRQSLVSLSLSIQNAVPCFSLFKMQSLVSLCSKCSPLFLSVQNAVPYFSLFKMYSFFFFLFEQRPRRTFQCTYLSLSVQNVLPCLSVQNADPFFSPFKIHFLVFFSV